MNACLTYVRDANSQGITSKAIRNKIGPNEITVPVIRKAIEALEKSGQIKSFKSIHVSRENRATIADPVLMPATDYTTVHCCRVQA